MNKKTFEWYEYIPGYIIMNFHKGKSFNIDVDKFILWLIDKKIITWQEAYPKYSKKLKDIFKPRTVNGQASWYAGMDNSKKMISLLNNYYTENGNDCSKN